MDEIDEFTLAVGLPAYGLNAETAGGVAAECLDIGELVVAVNLRFPRAKKVQVRAVEHVNRLGHPNVDP
jgi:hypothetical protein